MLFQEDEHEDEDLQRNRPASSNNMPKYIPKSDVVLFQKNYQHGPDVTPLPWSQVFVVTCVQLCEAAQINVLFPFLVFMVEDFGVPQQSLGTYSGILAASFCGAQFVSSIVIGRCSDRYGRKSMILAGLAGSAASILVFGSAKTYTQALLGRLISGLLNGNIACLKSFLGEITDDSNSGLAFSMLSLGWGCGVIIAPIIGGMLAKPSEQQQGPVEQLFGHVGLFQRFPYLLPCLVVTVFQMLTFLLALFIMKEPRHSPHRRHRRGPRHKNFGYLASSSEKQTAGMRHTDESLHRQEYQGLEMMEMSMGVEAAMDMATPQQGRRKHKQAGGGVWWAPWVRWRMRKDAQRAMEDEKGGTVDTRDDGEWDAERLDCPSGESPARAPEEIDPNAISDEEVLVLRNDMWDHEDFGSPCKSSATQPPQYGSPPMTQEQRLLSTLRTRASTLTSITVAQLMPASSEEEEADEDVLVDTAKLREQISSSTSRSSSSSYSSSLVSTLRRAWSGMSENSARYVAPDTIQGASCTHVWTDEQGEAMGRSEQQEHEIWSPSRSPRRQLKRQRDAVEAEDMSCARGQPMTIQPYLKDLLLSTATYAVICTTYIFFDETLPLLCKLSVEQGGLGFQSDEIGALLSISGLSLIVFGVIVFPYLQHKWGHLRCLQLGVVCQLPMFVLWPLQTQLVDRPAVLWPVLAIAIAYKALVAAFVFTPIMVMVNNSVPREFLGAANGFGQCCASMARTIGPAAGGLLWSLGLQTGCLYMNWGVMIGLTAITLVLVAALPPRLDSSHRD